MRKNTDPAVMAGSGTKAHMKSQTERSASVPVRGPCVFLLMVFCLMSLTGCLSVHRMYSYPPRPAKEISKLRVLRFELPNGIETIDGEPVPSSTGSFHLLPGLHVVKGTAVEVIRTQSGSAVTSSGRVNYYRTARVQRSFSVSFVSEPGVTYVIGPAGIARSCGLGGELVSPLRWDR